MAFRIDWIQLLPQPGQPPRVTAHYNEPHPRDVDGRIGGDFICASPVVLQRARALAAAVRDEIAASYTVTPEPVD